MASRSKAAYDPLPPKQRAFVEAAAGGATYASAARKAGYTTNHKWNGANVATNLLEKPAVRSELTRLQRQNQERNQVSRDMVIDGLKDAIKDAKLLADPMAQISGWREIAKMCGFYEPIRHEITLSHEYEQAREQVRTMPTERLLELAGGAVVDAEFKLVDDDE